MVNSLLQRMKASIYQSTCLAIQGGFLLGGSLDLEYYEEVAGVCLAFRLLSTPCISQWIQMILPGER